MRRSAMVRGTACPPGDSSVNSTKVGWRVRIIVNEPACSLALAKMAFDLPVSIVRIRREGPADDSDRPEFHRQQFRRPVPGGPTGFQRGDWSEAFHGIPQWGGGGLQQDKWGAGAVQNGH